MEPIRFTAMYLMYVDESGDPGITNSPTNDFFLSGTVFHELRWHDLLTDLLAFRTALRTTYGLKVRDEIHATDFLNGPSTQFRGISRDKRLAILRRCLDWIDGRQEIRLINVRVQKAGKATPDDVYEAGWRALIQRFENTLVYGNFAPPKNPDDRGIILSDDTNGLALRNLLRRMRRYNPVPHARAMYPGGYRQLPLQKIVEDPIERDSGHSYFIQMTDVVAYFLRQHYYPNAFVRGKGAAHYLGSRLPHVLLRVAAPSDPLGVVTV